MCKIMEDMRKETVKETAIKMLKDNVPAEKVAEYSGLSLEEVEELKKSL